MAVTVIFVFSDECGSCTYFKEQLYSQVSDIFTKAGAKLLEFTATTLQGFKKGTAPYAFLEEVSMFPCIICVKTSILERYGKGEIKEEILNSLYVWNGTVVPNSQQHKIVGINPQTYGILPQDFERYYKDFLASPAYKNEVKPALAHSAVNSNGKLGADKHSREASLGKGLVPAPSYPAHKTGLRAIGGCCKVKGIPITKK